MANLYTLERASWTTAKRKQYLKDHPENHAGPNGSFPIEDASDVGDAWGLAGHAENPDAVRAKIKSIAKRLGLESGLPDTATEDDKKEDRAMMAAEPTPATDDGAEHGPMTGKHSHGHAHSLDGYDHEHEHEHNNDNVHDHAHMHAQHRADMPTHAFLYAPITRIDKEKREIEGVATSEAVDSYKTIFSYEASKRAFQKWIERTANVREMHERKAVGKGIGVYFDDEQKKVHVRTRVSRSADGENTWIKFEEGILNGLSVGAINPIWDTTERNGKKYPYLTSYDLSELSYVDNASNPDAQGLVLCRADGLTELVDTSEETPSPAPAGVVASSLPVEVERAGARLSSDSRAALHDMRDKAMSLCGCDECAGMQDGKEDDGDDTMDRTITAALERMLPGVIERIMAPVYQRQQQLLARMAQTPENTPPTIDTAALEERLTTAIVERVASASDLSGVRAELSAVKETVERIERQPAVGLAPILNGSRPVEKTFPLDRAHTASPVQASTMQNALSTMQGAGMLESQDMQMKAAALLLQMQQR